MLGYGLVEVPLTVYNYSRTSYMLSYVQFKLSQLYNEKIDTEERLESLVDEVSKLCLQIKYNDPLRTCLEQIVKIVPEQYSNRVKLIMDDYEDYRTTTTTTTTNDLTDLPTEKQLIKLHGLLKKYKHIAHRIEASWIHLISEGFYLEDIFTNEQNTNHSFVTQSPIPKSRLRKQLFNDYPMLGKVRMTLSRIKERERQQMLGNIALITLLKSSTKKAKKFENTSNISNRTSKKSMKNRFDSSYQMKNNVQHS